MQQINELFNEKNINPGALSIILAWNVQYYNTRIV